MTTTKSVCARTRQFTPTGRCQTEPAADEPGDSTVGSIETVTHDAETEVADTHSTNWQRGPER